MSLRVNDEYFILFVRDQYPQFPAGVIMSLCLALRLSIRHPADLRSSYATAIFASTIFAIRPLHHPRTLVMKQILLFPWIIVFQSFAVYSGLTRTEILYRPSS